MMMYLCVMTQRCGLYMSRNDGLYAIRIKLLVKSQPNFIYRYFKYLISSKIKSINPREIIFDIYNMFRYGILALVLPKSLMVA